MTRIDPREKYVPFKPVPMPDRTWPGNTISKAPTWCTVDLRDGNQALIEPMGDERKERMFKHLVAIGFKEIEIGFPAASQTDFDFARKLIETDMIPDDVTIQVLVQARKELIDRTFEAIRGARRAIVHLYNSTSTLQRRVVFQQDKDGITAMAVQGATWIKEHAAAMPETEVVYQYSPESFTGTELDYAVEICEAVMDVYQPTPEKPLIVNLPATVEMSTPNVYADQMEWFARKVKDRDSLVLSIHPHNDRGCAVAAAELALLAGVDRIEGTLFGNGERTGNVDIVTLAMNMFSQGIDPGLDFSDINSVRRMAEHCTRLPVHPRHPYAGDLVFTAFSGSHQDAIKKGLAALRQSNSKVWEVPYLPIDPADIGRSYEAIIRINSQSGKGGIAYIMENDHGFDLPRRLQAEFSQVIQKATDESETEHSSEEIWQSFQDEYLNANRPIEFVDHKTVPDTHATEVRNLTATLRVDGEQRVIEGRGNGPIDGYCNALRDALGVDMSLVDYEEHAVGKGADTTAVCYVEVRTPEGGTLFGVGMHRNIVTASLRAVTSAANRLAKKSAAAN
ncbi:MAG: 2-isopropylmalate synthase [Hyphomicrobiales bacterium]|nr:2-isopropylmalate synthase [Hyphomicrobiales bacterium]MCP5373820.1 2-isopropylmalate synthase [Hyphomicrobiales bacterium]